MALVWKEITDPQLAWELRQAGLLHWKTVHGEVRRYNTDADGFGWTYRDWLDRYVSVLPRSGVHLEE